MKIGELFLDLGIKGTDKTLNSIVGVKKGLSDTASMSLEAKAAIIGTMYALERLFATSGKAGTTLTNFNALTGESVQTLQKYQYAGRQVGISNEETANSFKTLQTAMTKTMLGQGNPSGLARVSLLTGGITQKDIQDYMKNPELLIQRLEQYAAKEKDIGLRNETLKSFGLGDNFISGLSRNAFRPDALNKAPTYSDKEVSQLDKANIAWSNLGTKIEMAVGHFNARHGVELVNDFSKITTQVVKLAEAFTRLAEKIHLFDGIGKVFEGWTKIFSGATSTVNQFQTPQGRRELASDAKNFVSEMPGTFLEIGKDLASWGNQIRKEVFSPTPPKGGLQGSTVSQQNDVVINNHFQHPGTDHNMTSHSMKHAVNQAMRQLGSQYQVT